MKKPNTPAAMLRVANALKLIESAQAQLERACAELSTLRHGSGQWKRVGQLHDRVKAQWYTLRNFSQEAQSLTVDSEPE